MQIKNIILTGIIFIFSESSVTAQQPEYELIPFLKANGRWTYADAKTKKPMMDKDFQEAKLFSEGNAIVRDYNKMGVIDKKGNFIIPLKYEEIYHIKGKFISQTNTTGQKAAEHTAYELSPGGKEKLITYFFQDEPEKIIRFYSNKKYGYIDQNRKIVIPAIYSLVHNFVGNFARVNVGLYEGLIDTSGKMVIQPEYRELRYDPVSRLVFARNKEKLVGFLDSTGKKIIDFIFFDADYYFKGNYVNVVDENRNAGVIDKTGKIVIPLIYKFCYPVYNERIAVIKKEGNCGMIDLKGNIILPFEFDYIWDSEGNDPIIAFKNKLAGILNQKFQLVVPYKYTSIRSANPDVSTIRSTDSLIAQLDGKYGMIDITGKVIIPFEWDELNVFDWQRRLFQVKKGEKFGLLNAGNKLIVPVRYRQIYSYSNGWLYATNEFFETIYTDPEGHEFIED